MERWRNLHPDTRRKLIIGLKCAGGAGVVIGGAIVILPIGGFGAGGVASGSAAAAWQGCIGAAVQSGSWFATFQSAGAAGLAGTTKVGLGTVGAIAANVETFYPKKDPGDLDLVPSSSPTQRSIGSISAVCLQSVASTLKPPGSAGSANVACTITDVPSAASCPKNDPNNPGLLSSPSAAQSLKIPGFTEVTKVANATIGVVTKVTDVAGPMAAAVGVTAIGAAKKSVNLARKLVASAKSAIIGVKDDDKQ